MMRCADCRDALTAYIDDELMPDEAAAVREHLSHCAECARTADALTGTSRVLKENLVRYTAPDVLKARIRSALAQPDVFAPASTPRRMPVRSSWTGFAAAGVAIAAVSSAMTFAAIRQRTSAPSPASEIVASHIRSLMPGHLTDVASTDQHNVKPWFNGRIDLSPPVPSLDSLGFTLVGGRLDYIGGRVVAVAVYARRQHLINVYSWPVGGAQRTSPAGVTVANGYNLVHWQSAGVELWAVSDLNRTELDQFVASFQGVSAGRSTAADSR